MIKLKALVFDLFYERYSGVTVYVKILQGELVTKQRIRLVKSSSNFSHSNYKVETIGINTPEKKIIKQKLIKGEIG